jgi:hypothetical protein
MSPRKDDPDVIDKERQVVELRRAGATYEECARAVGYATAQGAYLAYHRALKRTLLDAGADEMRNVESDRLERLQRAAWPNAMAGETQAINAVIRIMERRARLLGLDAPSKLQVEATVYDTGTIESEVAKLQRLISADSSEQGLLDESTGEAGTDTD